MKLLAIASMSVSVSNNGVNLPPNIALKSSTMMGSFRFSKLTLSRLFFVFLIDLHCVLTTFTMTRSRPLLMSAPRRALGLCLLIPDRTRFYRYAVELFVVTGIRGHATSRSLMPYDFKVCWL